MAVIDRTKLSNSFEFVAVASQRARQLMRGALPRVAGAHKSVRTAQMEVLDGQVQKTERRPAADSEAP